MHAITEVHGEHGLRERFRREIARFGEADQERLRDALDLAGTLHRDDRRTREPYVNHLLRVAIRLAHHYEVRDVDVVIAGLLHDAVEDHAADLAPDAPAAAAGALRVLGERFGARVARLVAAVTNPAWDPARDRHVQYREHLARSLAAEPWARVLKASDFTDNGVGIIYTAGPKTATLARKYRPLVPILRGLIARPDSPVSPSVKRHIGSQLDLAEERFRAILGPS
ncbi:hypothetical protein GCM10010124_36260 [Pilimelia terevasa]|uniref:HD domain-containing protein n=2 Tax=Pilimelia terevasa TaxID=53372 RepID=A0A8J3BUP7_9ACTN|nr:hypothetical protein GCM10010124_36260 [Pilimelia terevasa]